MARKVLGRARYSATRLAGIMTLTAVGETPNRNDKVDFEQLPFMIHPPMFAFFFIHQDVGLTATKPFLYEEVIAFPKDARSIRIQDADGFHDVPISEVVVPPIEVGTLSDDGMSDYCVYEWIGINRHMIAKCDAPVPAVYSRVFGPATYPQCEAYVKENGGI